MPSAAASSSEQPTARDTVQGGRPAQREGLAPLVIRVAAVPDLREVPPVGGCTGVQAPRAGTLGRVVEPRSVPVGQGRSD